MNVEDKRVNLDTAESAEQPTVVYERDDREMATEAVVAAVSSALETTATELDPIYDVVDSDALDALFPPDDARKSGMRDTTGMNGHVTFLYGGQLVRIGSDGAVRVFSAHDG
ncbi:HalOD1 output domain-containing protein [Halorussus litoreus]|uniref:HalOD1 output domain-containing protein n=1 Tax=Halorussus litoreus TaxID=1710536 RepID=UPI0018E583F4|nr:HalOD1 output domain-containing protein [Halorussus litoreus]